MRSPGAVLRHSRERLRREIETDEAEAATLSALLKERCRGRFASADEFCTRTALIVAKKRAEKGLSG